VLTAGGALVSDLGDALARDPEVRQARMIAEAARVRLVACVSRPEDGIDLAEAQGMVDALRNAQMLAEDAEDRVLRHRGLLTSAEADRRAARRRPAVTGTDEPPQPRQATTARWGRRMGAGLGLALAGVVVGVAIARRYDVRLPLMRR
jgi:hypothetical protein